MKRWCVVAVLMLCGSAWARFDHGYACCDTLLEKRALWLPEKHSRVDYAGLYDGSLNAVAR